MKKIDICIKMNNMNEFEVNRLYHRLDGNSNPLHPTTIEYLKKEIESVLGYKPEDSK